MYPTYTLFIRRMQSLRFYSLLLGPVSDHVLINRVRKGRALHHVVKYSLAQFDRLLIVVKNLMVIPKCELFCSN